MRARSLTALLARLARWPQPAAWVFSASCLPSADTAQTPGQKRPLGTDCPQGDPAPASQAIGLTQEARLL